MMSPGTLENGCLVWASADQPMVKASLAALQGWLYILEVSSSTQGSILKRDFGPVCLLGSIGSRGEN